MSVGFHPRSSMELELPSDYRVADTLAYQGRDPESPSEQVLSSTLRKALWLQGEPNILSLNFEARRASATMQGDGDVPLEVVVRLLGLHLDPGPFERQVQDDPLLGPLVKVRPGLRVMLTLTPFEALLWAILGQQINLTFAFRLRRQVIRRYGTTVDDLVVHPRPSDLAIADPEEMRTMQISRAKAACIVQLSQAIHEGRLDLDGLANQGIAAAEARLRTEKGIGRWTSHYVLMRGLGLADCVPLGDSALATALERGLHLSARPGPKDVDRLMQPYAPYRSLATFHLWTGLHDFLS